jgi:H+-transporting ATP synthase F0 complex subunit s
VDRSRVEAIGPDRAAAEWILRLGGSVKFKEFDYWNSDYNLLPSASLHLEAINANGLAVTSNGLEHLGSTLLLVLLYWTA